MTNSTMMIRSCIRLLLLSFVTAGFQTMFLHAQDGIGEYLRKFADYRFRKLSEIDGLDGLTGTGLPERAILDEYILRVYSQWQVTSLHSNQTSFKMDVHEMEDEVGAFGLFSIWDHFQKGAPKQLNLSLDNEYWDDQTLIFWKGKYFFRLHGSSAGSGTKEVFHSFAKDLIPKISLLSLHPLTVIHLPTKGLQRDSVRVYLGEASFVLDDDFPDSMIPALGFDGPVEISHGRYEPDGNRLYLIAYPTIEMAALHFAKLQNAMQNYFSPEGVYMKRSGVLIPVFFGPEPAAQSVLSNVEYVPSIKWIYRKEKDREALRVQAQSEVASFLHLVARSLLLTLVFAMLTVGGGFAAGLLRYEILRRFPGIRKRDEMIRLRIVDPS